MRSYWLEVGIALALLAPVAASSSEDDACRSLTSLDLPDVSVTAASRVDVPVAHCKADGVIGREIRFSVWLPDDWNGRFFMGGGGGFVGTVQNQAINAGAFERGYASAGTDTGHQGGDASWALNDLERIVNYGHVAVHRVTAVAKHITAKYYDRRPSKAYFFGCSNGGRQALQSAQRYPDDFDGIVAGAPAYHFTGVVAAFLDITRKMYPDPEMLAHPVLGEADRAALRRAIVTQCDADDGIADDVLADPRDCDFDPERLACKGSGNRDGCLSAAELAAVRSIYGGATDAAGRTLFHGFPLGGEDKPYGWGRWLAGNENGVRPGVPSLAYHFSVGFMQNFVHHDPAWSYRRYDFANFERETRPYAATMNATSPDLSAFRARGGKLLLYHGWSDSALSANATIAYVDEVYAAAANDRTDVRDDVRLFLLPGVAHCGGGVGPDRVSFLDALNDWVETGTAPSELGAAYADGSGARKLCAYPRRAYFLGGNDKDPSRFECR